MSFKSSISLLNKHIKYLKNTYLNYVLTKGQKKVVDAHIKHFEEIKDELKRLKKVAKIIKKKTNIYLDDYTSVNAGYEIVNDFSNEEITEEEYKLLKEFLEEA